MRGTGPVQAEIAAKNAVASLTFRTLGQGWASCVDVFVEVANVSQLNGRLLTPDGQSVRRPSPDFELYRAWAHLRRVMSGPDRGAWMTARLRVSSDGRYSMDFEWDERPVWPGSVDAEGVIHNGDDVDRSALLNDLRRYPREARMTPAWLADLQAAPRTSFRNDVWPDELRAMQGNADWLRLAEGIKRLLSDAILDDDLDLLEDDELADGLLQDVLYEVDTRRFLAMAAVVRSSAAVRCEADATDIDLSGNARQMLFGNPSTAAAVEATRDAIEALVAFERSVVTPANPDPGSRPLSLRTGPLGASDTARRQQR